MSMRRVEPHPHPSPDSGEGSSAVGALSTARFDISTRLSFDLSFWKNLVNPTGRFGVRTVRCASRCALKLEAWLLSARSLREDKSRLRVMRSARPCVLLAGDSADGAEALCLHSWRIFPQSVTSGAQRGAVAGLKNLQLHRSIGF